MIRATTDNLDSVIKKLMAEYGEEAQKTMEEVAVKVGKKATKKLKEVSPKLTGDYAKGWSTKTVKTAHGVEVISHNKTEYQLTHLLEHEHANRNGGRTQPVTHIAPVNDEAQEEFYDTVIRELGG